MGRVVSPRQRLGSPSSVTEKVTRVGSAAHPHRAAFLRSRPGCCTSDAAVLWKARWLGAFRDIGVVFRTHGCETRQIWG